MKAYIKFFFEILPLAVFFTVNSVDNIQIVDTIYNLFESKKSFLFYIILLLLKDKNVTKEYHLSSKL